MAEAAQPAVLVLHDGELEDVVSLLAELVGDGFVDRRGRAGAEDQRVSWRLVVATPQRLVELQKDAGLALARAGTVRVAVLAPRESRTLRAMLKRVGVELLVRRPVHPAALRLLLLHALYSGPEKRRTQRVSVGAPIRFRSGLRRRNAILADLSTRGCRLLTRHALERGRRITVQLPGALGPGRTLSLRAKVVRTEVAEDAEPGCEAVAVTFDRLPAGALPLLRKTVDAHACGPATLGGREAVAVERPTPPLGLPRDAASERRSSPRRSYEQRVVALSQEATRVLIGRDLSLGGMRVDANEELAVGDTLQVALHVGGRAEPLVVDARVARDDGEEGVLLRFLGLSDSARKCLRRILDLLPVLGARLVEGDDEDDVIVSQVLEQRANQA